MGEQAIPESDRAALSHLAASLRRAGLATPTMMLIDLMAPFCSIADHMLRVLSPLVPPSTSEQARVFMRTLHDEHRREFLEHLLGD